ncbi:MAG TPA: aminotransferase class III-fold pyridoxal phosphate-dependent enzyme, partial [Bdellovibrionota bacterium]|nr:aminotransferase class III-fold pyridoxal phosphate-dependent enzyme [Bdellovibrionota bacterium]
MNERLPFGEQIGMIRSPIPGPRSIDLGKRLGKVEAPGITYISNDFPVFWEQAHGSNVQDVDGNIFVDLSAAFGVASLGHRQPAVTAAISRQLARLPHGMGDVHPPAIKVELLEWLTLAFPQPGAQAILCSSGSEAVEAALKTAALVSGRPGVISFEGAYHGLSYGTLAVSGQLKFREPFHRQLGQFARRARFPRYQNDRNREVIEQSIAELQQIVNESQKTQVPVGAILLEPIQGRAGVIVPPQGWLREIRDFANRNHLVLIADEIMTGFGRTGTRFAVDREKVVPDLLCVGKALTGTLPFAACVGTEAVMHGWPVSTGEALHTNTFLGHPLGCAAALASIHEIENKDLATRADRLGREAMTEMRSWQRSLPMIEEVRGRGFMIGLALSQDRRTGLAFDVAKRALAKGLIILPSGMNGNVLTISPPLTIGGRQLE